MKKTKSWKPTAASMKYFKGACELEGKPHLGPPSDVGILEWAARGLPDGIVSMENFSYRLDCATFFGPEHIKGREELVYNLRTNREVFDLAVNAIRLYVHITNGIILTDLSTYLESWIKRMEVDCVWLPCEEK